LINIFENTSIPVWKLHSEMIISYCLTLWLQGLAGHVVFSALHDSTVWTVDFETPVCKNHLLFISADAAQEKKKREETGAAHWCFKVCSPYMKVLYY
jgi:hypothetical protein